MTLKIGDTYKWTAHSQGNHARRVGKIIAVIPAGQTPFLAGQGNKRGNRTGRLRPAFARRASGASQKTLSTGAARHNISYLVVSNTLDGDIRRHVYWPR